MLTVTSTHWVLLMGTRRLAKSPWPLALRETITVAMENPLRADSPFLTISHPKPRPLSSSPPSRPCLLHSPAPAHPPREPSKPKEFRIFSSMGYESKPFSSLTPLLLVDRKEVKEGEGKRGDDSGPAIGLLLCHGKSFLA